MKNIFLKSTISKNNINLKSTILRKKLFLKSRFWKKFCTQKITSSFLLPHKLRKFCVLRALLKSTILKKKFFLKSMILKKKNIFKKHNFEEKIIFKKHDFEWKSFCKKHDFDIKFFRLVRFWIKLFTTFQILNENFYNVSDFESIF